jgi:hypothetical protein
MPLTDMGQIAKGLTGVWRQADEKENEREEFDRDLTEKRLERLTWYLWHGNVYQAPARTGTDRVGTGGLARGQ